MKMINHQIPLPITYKFLLLSSVPPSSLCFTIGLDELHLTIVSRPEKSIKIVDLNFLTQKWEPFFRHLKRQ